jgi:hypothetical protein
MDSSWVNWREQRLSARTVWMSLGLTTLTTLGTVLAVMNPGEAAYEAYATQKVVTLLDQNLCAEAPKVFNLKQDCKSLLISHRSEIKQFITNNTQHQNFIFFSIYTTDVSIAPFTPTYRVETLGVLRQFHIYDTAQN